MTIILTWENVTKWALGSIAYIAVALVIVTALAGWMAGN